MSVLLTGGGVIPSKVIFFTINGTEYLAEEGMTWVDFVNSDYNTLSLTVKSDGRIVHPSGGYIWRYVSGTLTFVNYNGKETTVVSGVEYYWDE